MIVIYAKCIVSGQNVEEFLKVAGKLVEDTRKEPGNISYELIQCREGRLPPLFRPSGRLPGFVPVPEMFFKARNT